MNIMEAMKHVISGNVVERPDGVRLLPGTNYYRGALGLAMHELDFFADDWEVVDGVI